LTHSSLIKEETDTVVNLQLNQMIAV